MCRGRSVFERLFSFFKPERIEKKVESALDERIQTGSHDTLDTEFRSNSEVFKEVVETFKGTPLNTEFSRSEIIDLVVALYPHRKDKESIIPSDYCYNRTNN